MKRTRIATLLASAAIAIGAAAQNNIAEEVVWWIGDQPILKSEVEETYQTLLYETPDIGGDPNCVIPEKLAIEKLYIHQAEIDSITVSEAQVASQVEGRINMLISNLGSQEKLEQFYRRSMPEIRETMSESVRNQLITMQVQRSLISGLKVTPSDVRKYFSGLSSDSIPYVPVQVEVQIMTLNPIIPREEIDDIKGRLRDYAEKVNSGESDFSTLAILYSEDTGSSMRGGETGFLARTALDPEYASVAFNLNDPKKVSKIVQSQFGYHIIQLIEKRGDRINTRHILLRPKVSDKDLTNAVNRLDSIRADILAEKFTFEDAVPFLSQDKDTKNNRGIMVNTENGYSSPRFEMSQLPQEVAKEVSRLSVGEISRPFIMKDQKNGSDIVAIVKLTSRIDAHRANLSDDYQLIKNLYENTRQEELINDWIEKKIAETYVRVEEGWRNCDFKHKGWIKESGEKK